MECKFCRADIPSHAKKCMFCATDFAEEARKEENRNIQKKQRGDAEWAAQSQAQAVANKEYRKNQEEQLIIRVAQENRTLNTIKSWPVSQCIQHLDLYEQFLGSAEAGVPSTDAFGWRSKAQRKEWGFWNYFGEFTHFEKDGGIPSLHFEREWQAFVSQVAHQAIRDRWQKIKIAQAVREERLKGGLALIAGLKKERELIKSKELKKADFLEYVFIGFVIIFIVGVVRENTMAMVISGVAAVGSLIAWKLIRRKIGI